MSVRRSLPAVIGAVTLVLGLATAAAPSAAADPCGFYETRSDAYYNHCTNDGSHVVINVRASLSPDHERCVGPGKTWLGSASKIQGAHYVGRTC
ncbi:DUF6355 family natural product biosynthesis protein [Streptomyces flavidovirens]|uniref:DUF6355 family natural product biosynthesis protein n=1 Tax=Streptomyces flavidovirens TaxID=67298 RepID=UPI003698256B